MVQYSRDNNTKKYISADGQIMWWWTAYKGDDGKWSLDKPQEQTNNQSDFNNKGNTTQTTPTTPTPTPTETQTPTNPISQQPVDMTAEEYRKNQNNNQNNNQNFNVSPDLDQTKFQQDPWKITVQEWTAQQTGRPDYQANSEARLNEMKGNLDHYFATSPRMFNDRETFNRVFEYNNRESEAQRQLLDSYWKRKEDMDKASQYTSWESIMNWMNNSEITTDQLNLIKDNDPEAYRKWQQLQEDEIKKRIVNDIVPPSIEAISWKINWMIEALGIQAQEALDIEWIYNDTMDRTWAWKTLEDCNNTVKKIEEITNKKTTIMNRYSASTWGTVSDALAAARMQKAIAPYNEQLQGLQYQYQDYSNLYSQKQATALQAANVRALQANENQRIWNQKCQALGFATSALSYRTPEEQAQLQLQTLQAQNDINLSYQSRLNDLNRYNAYATAKMQNQLQQELTDLSVEDETQLKANLNNALSDYYKNYGDIIQRSQAQTVEDIIAYAKKNGISVAQAMTENFIKPLQNKKEYKQKIATDYGMLSKQSIGTINWRSVIMTTNPNWSISYQFIDDPESVVSGTKPYDIIDSKYMTSAPINYGYNTLGTFLLDKKTDGTQKGGQCWKFVNDYLESIWFGRYYDDELSTKLNSVNSDMPVEWAIAVFDYGHKSSDWINHGHVGIITKVNADWSFEVVDSNYNTDKPETISKRTIYPWSPSYKWCFDMSKPPRATSTGDNTQTTTVDRLTLTALRNWQIVNSKVPETIEQLVKAGFSEDEINEALNQNMEYYLPDDQRAEKNAILSRFNQNDIVQNFQSATEQFLGLSAAVNEANWAWDLASIYMFMRSQDPRSVVREWEFEMAASTMWLWWQVQTWFSKLANWQRLTPEQRQNFIDVTVKVLEAKKQAYQLVYDEATQQMKAASIPSVYYPMNWAKELDSIINKLQNWSNTTWPDNVINDIYASAMNTPTQTGVGTYQSFGWYDGDWLHMMINEKL